MNCHECFRKSENRFTHCGQNESFQCFSKHIFKTKQNKQTNIISHCYRYGTLSSREYQHEMAINMPIDSIFGNLYTATTAH